MVCHLVSYEKAGVSVGLKASRGGIARAVAAATLLLLSSEQEGVLLALATTSTTMGC